MSSNPPFAARPLSPSEHRRASELAGQGGVHGVYVGNFLSSDRAGRDGELLAFWGADDLLGLAFFGSRGNLILLEGAALDGVGVAAAIRDSGFGWRIVLGSAAAVGALADQELRAPLVHRTQVYYGVSPGDVPAVMVRDDVRPAERRDQSALLQAALDLNAIDLLVDPRRVHKPWLRDSIRRRVRAGQTRVVGPAGRPMCKLDVGSEGRFGVVLEGVYTFPEARRQQLASGLVATVARQASSSPLVCLHVAEDNAPARRAYERAGMKPIGTCSLLLKS